MNLSTACINILKQLANLVSDVSQDDFVKPSQSLSHSTIGQHLRHTLEFFICFEKGFNAGIINYDKRAHDKLIESDKLIASATIERIINFVNNLQQDKSLKLEVGYDLDKEEFITIDTTATRELVYNIEHAVHHMAIMKIGVREISPLTKLPAEFGVAASTVRYRETVTTEN
jgi:uncharacterized damage-inducible protein DinB